MLKRGDKGQAVVELQTMIIECGYALPRWGADGDLGTETLGALAMLLVDHYEHYTDQNPNVVSDSELEFVRHLHRLRQGVAEEPGIALFYDLRATAARVQDRGPRPWHTIAGIVLHQTACELGHRAARWNTVGAHLGVMTNGAGTWMHDFDRIVWHANGFNRRYIGIEIDGLYPGLKGNMKTVWDDPSTPYREQPTVLTRPAIKTAKEMIRWTKAYAESRGAKIQFLVPHRQASKDRRNDPGEEIWEEVGLPLLAELGLKDGGRGFKIDDGYPIPEDWDSRYKGIKY